MIAREHIRDLVATYAVCADGGHVDELADLFAPEGVLETPDGSVHHGRAAIRSWLGRTRDALAPGAAIRALRHHVSSLQIAVADTHAASGSAYFLVVTAAGPDHWGRYRDRYACRNGIWQFSHRRVRLDGRRPHADPVLPG